MSRNQLDAMSVAKLDVQLVKEKVAGKDTMLVEILAVLMVY